MVRSAMNIARRRVHRDLRSHRRPRSHRSAMACGGHGPSSYPAPTVPASCRSRRSPIGTPAPPRRHPSVKHRSTERGAIPSVAPTAPIEHLGARNGHGHVQRAPARAPAQPKAQRLVFARWRTPRSGPINQLQIRLAGLQRQWRQSHHKPRDRNRRSDRASEARAPHNR